MVARKETCNKVNVGFKGVPPLVLNVRSQAETVWLTSTPVSNCLEADMRKAGRSIILLAAWRRKKWSPLPYKKHR